MKLTDWIRQVVSRCVGQKARRPYRRGRRRHWDRRGTMIGSIQTPESRLLLTNLVNVSVTGDHVRLTDASDRKTTTGDTFDISYTATQMVLTGRNGTEFQIGSQRVATHTINFTSPVGLSINLGRRADQVNVTGNGTAELKAVFINLGQGRGDNSLALTNVIASDLIVEGGRRADAVTLDRTTIHGRLNARLGRNAADTLELRNTTVIDGASVIRAKHVTASDTTFHGTVRNIQRGPNSTLNLTNTTFDKSTTVVMGRDGVVNMLSSPTGPNTFKAGQTVIGRKKHPIIINTGANTVVNQVTPKLTNARVNVVSNTQTAPTVNGQTATNQTPTITGTWDATNARRLTVAVNGVTYVLGQNANLTSPSTGNWSLNLSGAPLPAGPSTVTATTTDAFGNTRQGTGVVTTPVVNAQQQAIDTFLTSSQLTAQRTASGLNYVVTTPSTGAIPSNGQRVSVNYTGRLLNLDGTLGAVFDSNTDPQFNHVQPFQFTVGQGQVIRGWDEAFTLLRVGSSAKLLIPSALGYGATGSGARIPPNSILVFDVTLLGIV